MKTYLKSDQNKKGFTLIELLIVIAIIGLLATLAIVSLTTAQKKARDTKRVADLKQLQNAVELYYSENATYPVSAAKSWTDFSGDIDDYITNIPQDPSNDSTNFYSYASNAAASEYVIKAKLEQPDLTALSGDDDVNYTASVAGWTGIDAVLSTEASAHGTADAVVDCRDTATDGEYCVSE